MNAPLPLSVMVPGRPTGADDSMRADDSDGYLRPTPPIVIPPQRSAGKLQYGNEHDSGVDVDNIHLEPSPSNTPGRGSIPSIHRPTSSESAGSFNSVHNPGLPVTPSPATGSPRWLAPNFTSGSRLVRQSPAPSANGSPWGPPHSAQKPLNSSLGDSKHPVATAIPARLSGDSMAKRPDSLLKSHDYEELPSSRVGDVYSYTDRSGTVMSPPPPQQQSSSSDSTDFLCDTLHPSDRLRHVYRRRQNPLYESHGSDTSNPVKSTGMIGCQCPCFVTLLVALVAVAAFVMAILVITGTTKTHVFVVSTQHSKSLEKALERIKTMENDYAALLSKFDEIQTNLTAEIDYNKNMSALLEGTTRQLELLHHNSAQQHDMLSELNVKYNKSENSITKLSERTENLSSTVEGTADLVGLLLSNRTDQRDTLTQLGNKWESLSTKFVKQNDSLSALQLQFHDLDTQVEAMQALPSKVNQLEKDVTKQTQTLAVIDGNWQRKFQKLSDNVTLQVASVSKMQGPPGVGNLTRCRHTTYTRGSAAADAAATLTPWVPGSRLEVNEWVILGVECSTTGGTGSELETKKKPDWGMLQYRCVCFGQRSSSVSSRHCTLHVWSCPRLS
ncbi:hypothetical protein NP493_449g02002 [Ridgeia piscesae]|uniref:Uncharacterized protein n=1 Tax=Ridgeia piscesae TaxID=27915 RepID=A0AAD9NTN1_RIDPI|nr:hypothetical protein NP493_449g02002 [Ridgeia piscesae]